MSASIRDRAKSREKRLGEVLYGVGEKTGQADSQVILHGCDPAVGTTATKLKVLAGEVVLAGQVVAIAGADNQDLTAGAATAAGQFRKVLVEVDAAGAVFTTAGAAVTTSQADAQLPAGDPSRIVVGWLELAGVFTVGTTAITAGMCKSGRTLYHA